MEDGLTGPSGPLVLVAIHMENSGLHLVQELAHNPAPIMEAKNVHPAQRVMILLVLIEFKQKLKSLLATVPWVNTMNIF